jgi:death-on-curing protein
MQQNDDYRSVAAALGTETDIKLITAIEVAAIHDAMIADFGGTPGVRDEGLLYSAVGRQLQTLTYGDSSVHSVAASLTFGVALNHAFLDGNKRTAFGAMIAFLDANDINIKYDPVEAHQVFMGLAAGRVTEQELSDWISGLIDDRHKYGNNFKP